MFDYFEILTLKGLSKSIILILGKKLFACSYTRFVFEFQLYVTSEETETPEDEESETKPRAASENEPCATFKTRAGSKFQRRNGFVKRRQS